MASKFCLDMLNDAYFWSHVTDALGRYRLWNANSNGKKILFGYAFCTSDRKKSVKQIIYFTFSPTFARVGNEVDQKLL